MKVRTRLARYSLFRIMLSPFVTMHHGIQDIEYDPVTQYKMNLFFTWLWFVAMPTFAFVPQLRFLWGGNLASLIIEELSIWALFISHFTDVSASESAIISAGRIDEIKGYKIFLVRKGKGLTSERVKDEPDKKVQ